MNESQREARAAEAAAEASVSTGTYGRYGEKLSWSYYDTFAMPVAGIGTFRLFVDPLGTGGKTLADTNLTYRGVPRGQKFVIYAVKGFATYTAAPWTTAQELAWQTYLDQTVVTARVTGKDALWQVTLQELIGQQVNAIHAPTVAGDNHMAHGYGRFTGQYMLNIPLVFTELVPFEVEVQILTAVAPMAGLRTKISLMGKLLRRS